MQNVLNSAAKGASKLATMAGNKASELVEIGKLKSKLSDVNQAKNEAKKEIGEYCYRMFQDGKIDDPNIIEMCKRIEEAIEHAAEIEAQIEQAKADYAAKNEVADPSLND